MVQRPGDLPFGLEHAGQLVIGGRQPLVVVAPLADGDLLLQPDHRPVVLPGSRLDQGEKVVALCLCRLEALVPGGNAS